MASILTAKSDTRPAGRSIPATAANGKPSKIPVRSNSSSGSASDDSDDGAKSSLKAKRCGKSKIPRAVPVKNVSTTTGTTGSKSCTLEEKCPQKSGMQQKLTSTKSSGANPKVGGIKAAVKNETTKKGGLKGRELKESPSFNAARSKTLGSRQDLGVQKSTKTSKVTPKTGQKAKEGSGLLEGEQDKPRRGATAKKSASQHPAVGKKNNEKLPLKVSHQNISCLVPISIFYSHES